MQNKLMIIMLLIMISGCSTYKSTFFCNEAKGSYCLPMDEVDMMINSGEIEKFNEERKDRRYKKKEENFIGRIKNNKINFYNDIEDDK